MDLSMAAYITLPICLFLLLAVFIPFFRSPLLYRWYTAIVLLFVLLLVLIDLEAFRAWGFRLDATPLKYLSSPKEVWASISHLPIFWILICFVLLYLLFLWLANTLLKQLNYLNQYNRRRPLQALFLLLALGLMIIPMRGGLQLAPMNQSTVYFSDQHFANLSALNVPWNFIQSLLKRKDLSQNPYNYMPLSKAKGIVDSLYAAKGSVEQLVDTSVKPNIILVIWESFTDKATHLTINGVEVTPNFNRLKREGIYFSDAYASGDRTDKGLTAILSGYPALPAGSIINYPAKADKLPSLPKLFHSSGYQTSFYYGGEPEFANIKSYLLEHHFDRIISEDDFAKKDQNSKWGAHDGVVLQRLAKEMKTFRRPFFTTWLTLSSHEPYETPVPVVFKGTDDATKFLNAHHYTDSCVNAFVQYCKAQPWWHNTILIIVADHGHPLPLTNNRAADFKIPILWLGGALTKTGATINNVVSQIDIAHTLVRQLRVLKNPFSFSKNSFDSSSNYWAFFTFNNGFGWIQPEKRIVFDNVGEKIILQEGNVLQSDVEAGKAIQQVTYEDFIKR
ncbi:MAG: LTA synthase family protein [Flavisolibacter sp.]|nr:LTA synthase family protein [Flavisolibacter sp.]